MSVVPSATSAAPQLLVAARRSLGACPPQALEGRLDRAGRRGRSPASSCPRAAARPPDGGGPGGGSDAQAARARGRRWHRARASALVAPLGLCQGAGPVARERQRPHQQLVGLSSSGSARPRARRGSGRRRCGPRPGRPGPRRAATPPTPRPGAAPPSATRRSRDSTRRRSPRSSSPPPFAAAARSSTSTMASAGSARRAGRCGAPPACPRAAQLGQAPAERAERVVRLGEEEGRQLAPAGGAPVSSRCASRPTPCRPAEGRWRAVAGDRGGPRRVIVRGTRSPSAILVHFGRAQVRHTPGSRRHHRRPARRGREGVGAPTAQRLPGDRLGALHVVRVPGGLRSY